MTKTGVLVFSIFILAIVLRIIVATHVDIGPDEMVYSVLPLNIISAKALGTIEQSPVYFYTVDIGYKIFGGVTSFTTRLPSILFGSLAVLLIFLVVVELFNDKAMALTTAFLFAISTFALRNNFEMDMMAYFLVLLSTLFFFRFLTGQRIKNLYLTAGFFAIAVLVKNIVIVFVPAYIITFFGYGFRNKVFFFSSENKFFFNNKLFLHILGAILLCVIITAPVFIYNYLTYTAKGVTDYYFSNILGIGETVHKGIQGKPWSFHTLRSSIQEISISKMPVQMFLGTIGMILLFRRRVYHSLFFVISMILLILYIGGKTASPSHYLWLPIVLSIYGAGVVCFVKDNFFQKVKAKHFFLVFAAALLIFNTTRLHDLITNTSATLQLNTYVAENIPREAIIIIDPRIYRGVHAWAFNEQYYLEGTFFPQLQETINAAPQEQRVSIPLYYIECGKGTNCGWKQEDFERIYNFSEQLSSFFRRELTSIAQIKEIDTFNIYRGVIKAPQGIYHAIDQTKLFWFYSVGWKYPEMNNDYYVAKGWPSILENFGLLILYLDVLMAVGAIPLTIYLFLKRENRE